MKVITLLFLVFGMFLFSSCNETKDTTDKIDTTVKENTQTTEKPEVTSKEEMTMKEKAGEEVAGNKVSKESQDKTKQLKVEDSKLQSASFTASSMHCSGCESTITSNLKKLNGVQDVKASFDTKQVEVVYAGDKITKEEIAKAITDSGFECKINN